MDRCDLLQRLFDMFFAQQLTEHIENDAIADAKEECDDWNPSSPLSVSKCTDNNINNQPTNRLICIHVYYAGLGSTRHVEHLESAETETLRPSATAQEFP